MHLSCAKNQVRISNTTHWTQADGWLPSAGRWGGFQGDQGNIWCGCWAGGSNWEYWSRVMELCFSVKILLSTNKLFSKILNILAKPIYKTKEWLFNESLSANCKWYKDSLKNFLGQLNVVKLIYTKNLWQFIVGFSQKSRISCCKIWPIFMLLLSSHWTNF